MTGWVLILAFVTVNGNSGVSITSATYANEVACMAAGTKAKSDLGSMLTTVRFSCSPQSGVR